MTFCFNTHVQMGLRSIAKLRYKSVLYGATGSTLNVWLGQVSLLANHSASACLSFCFVLSPCRELVPPSSALSRRGVTVQTNLGKWCAGQSPGGKGHLLYLPLRQTRHRSSQRVCLCLSASSINTFTVALSYFWRGAHLMNHGGCDNYVLANTLSL